jgi:hypothetical protein
VQDDDQQQGRNVRQRQQSDSSSDVAAAVKKALQSALKDMQRAVGSAVKDAVAHLPHDIRARKLVDGSKFTGRRPEISEIVEGSSTS